MSSFELPTLSHLGHNTSATSGTNTNPGSSTPTRLSSENKYPLPDIFPTSATMGMSSSSTSKHHAAVAAGGMMEAQEAPMESPVISREAGERDPLLLRGKIVSEGELNELRHRKSHNRSTNKQISTFYTTQNTHIENLLKPLSSHTADAAAEEEAASKSVWWAIKLSLYCNCVLAILQLYAAISSLSLSLFATCIDSVFDPFSNILLNYLHKKAVTADEKKWPMGGSRFETIGNVVYGSLMGMVNLILIVESIRTIATRGDSEEDTNKLHIPALVAVGVAFATKFGLFLFCYSIRKNSSQVQVLYEDHRNDLFVNGFGIFTSAAGAKIIWFLDPMGAMIIATGVMISWCITIYGQFKLLAGIAAPIEFQKLVIYKAMTFDPAIKQIDTCRVYHSGPEYFVEVDIVMDGEMPLWRAHDIAQDLQDQIEALPDVDRCFVHIDHETDHKPEHRKHA